MSELIVIGFDDEHTAFEMRAALAKLQKEYLIDMEDVVVVTKDEKDKVKLSEIVSAKGRLVALTGAEAVRFDLATKTVEDLDEVFAEVERDVLGRE